MARPSENSTLGSIEGVSVRTLARRYETPLFVYSHGMLIENFRRFKDAFAGIDSLIAYSMKCNSNEAVMRALIKEGAGLDIVSGGELARGLRAGVDPSKIIFAGVGKTPGEIDAALRAGIGMFNVESEPEVDAIARVARRMRVLAPVSLRINPDIDASTHHYIATGRKENKFGVPFARARRLCKKIAATRGLHLVGIQAHIGSQIMKSDAYIESLARLLELHERLTRDGHNIANLNIGGGYGIDYEHGRNPMDIAALARRVGKLVKHLGARLILEPGRSITGPAGFFITRVEYVKKGNGKSFAIVDAGMNDLIRPALYSAFHRIIPASSRKGARKTRYDIVGPICESGDFLGKNRRLPELRAGDLLVVLDAGAYGMVMASNYNSRPRAAEVMVRGRKHFLVRRRESFEDLVEHEVVPDFLR